MTFKKRFNKFLLIFLIFIILCSTIQPIVAENNTHGTDLNEEPDIRNIPEFNDGNHFYQEIIVNSEVTKEDALIHILLPFPFDYDKYPQSYRFYDSSGNPIPFHVFNATPAEYSISLKMDLNEGNNYIYFTGGNQSLQSVQNSEIYDHYTPLSDIGESGIFTLEVGNYNLIQYSAANHYGSYNTTTRTSFYLSSNRSYMNQSFTMNNSTAFYYWNPNATGYQMLSGYGANESRSPYILIDGTKGYSEIDFRLTWTNTSNKGMKIHSHLVNKTQPVLGDRVEIYMTRSASGLHDYTIACGMYTPIETTFGEVVIDEKVDGLYIRFVDGATGKVLRNGDNRNATSLNLTQESLGNLNALGVNRSSYVSYLTTNHTFVQEGVATTFNFTDKNTSSLIGTSVVYLPNFKYDQQFHLTLAGAYESYSTAQYILTIPNETKPVKLLTLPLVRATTANSTAVVGVVIDNYGNPIEGADITLNHTGTNNGTVYSITGGMYGRTVTGTDSYLITAKKNGYNENSSLVVTGGTNVTKIYPIVLQKLYNVSISVKDSETNETIKSFTLFLGENQEIKSTDNGTVLYQNISSGDKEVIIQADGYNQVTRSIYVGEDSTEFTLYVSKTDTSYYEPHVAQFAVRENNTGQLLKGVNVSVFLNGNKITSQLTGDDGTVSFKLSKYTSYRIIFSDNEKGIYKEIDITPSNYLYVIYVNSNKEQSAFDYNYNRYIAFNEIETIYDPEKINSIGFDSENTAAAVRYSVYNHKNDNKMNETTTIQFIDNNKTEINVAADLIVKDNSTTHYYIKIPAGTTIESGSLYKFKTIASHEDAKDSPVTLTKEWKVTFSSIKDGFNIFPGYENYYTYIAVAILLIMVGALASFQTTSVTVLISFMATLFFVWTGWLNLPVSAIVFLFLAFLIYVFKKVYQGGD